ncbi:hypothetical protein MPTK1_6g20100 [Marchantia polymorpha subsp. ruderalis]|uniref:Alpha 1,4-glycosyltransferase domain-containing protein n=4 Tax=Marchantia polymorpha TaxID=3197 RepID=A0AAF6BU19_MARPO|nr:hypothetical protein MARPO_0045s0054 [Marchantia polymorpha]BBN15503.1 hypothetical protein Mp_6g20100 [Marchantia polymorpha subsp. ruderalis]|eukprot:PTQ39385.1 hypothetical protein MARPO_0045s0054 [Marchantia polymorpha]
MATILSLLSFCLTMSKPRYRRGGRGWIGTGCGRYGRINICILAGILLLLGSVCFLQFRLAEDDKRGEDSGTLLGKNNRSAYSLDVMEHEKMRLLREGEERGLDLEREWRSMVNEEMEGVVGDSEGESNFEDELEAESRLNESSESEDEEDGGERFEELDTEMDMEDEDVDEFESFGGDVGEWLNEVDEFTGKKSGRNSENSVEMLNTDDKSAGKASTREKGGRDSRVLEERKLGVHSQSRKEILETRSSQKEGQEQIGKEISQAVSEQEGDKQVTKEAEAADGTNEESNSLVKQDTVSGGKSEPSWIQSLARHNKKVDGEENESVALLKTGQAFKDKTRSNTYLRGRKNGGSQGDLMSGSGNAELADVDTKISTYFKDSDVVRGVFSTDDEPVDDDILERVENMMDFEDVLMIKKKTNPNLEARLKKAVDKEAGKKDKGGKAVFDPLNPANNPLLQDPDTSEGSGLTKSDRVLLKAKRRTNFAADSLFEEETLIQRRVESESKKVEIQAQGIVDKITTTEKEPKRLDSTEVEIRPETSETKPEKAFEQLNEEQGSFEKVDESFDITVGQKKHQTAVSRGKVKRVEGNVDTRRWGHFPGLNPKLSFSRFMEAFLFDKKCGLRVFMAWTTPPWSFTIRHQRVLESLLSFHPDACVVVFSESIELDFFRSFVQDGYRIAVAMPQLQELLEDTPSEDFASIYLKWREVDLFYLHYTELLRLAALYKYGGIYLDMDMIVLKPLTSLRNTLGSELLPDGHTRPNGAAMFFERFSPFLNACMLEYTATYDEKLEQWNGAALVDRVVNAPLLGSGALSLEVRNSFSLRRPSVFFPVSSAEIFRYFVAPEDEISRREEDDFFEKILQDSFTFHLWNALTSKLVPEPGSLVQRIMERKCLRCTDIL